MRKAMASAETVTSKGSWKELMMPNPPGSALRLVVQTHSAT
jgi:hypothetical protein